jgi:phosphohistidine phosphatase
MPRLYFFRHAHAEETGARPDHDRELTAEGVRAARAAARIMSALNLGPLTLYSSPRVRAVQTAEIAAEALRTQVHISDEVNYDFNVDAVRILLTGLTGDVMFVGHEPTFSLTIGEITGGRVEMKKAGLARVDIPALGDQPLRGTLVWLIAPRLFEVLAP